MESWTTTGRPANPQDGRFGFNRTTRALEYYDLLLLAWTPVGGGGGGACLDAIATYDNVGGLPIIGAMVPMDTVQANTDGTNYSLAGGFVTILNDGDYLIRGSLTVWDPGAISANGWQGSLWTSPAGLGTWNPIVGSDGYGGADVAGLNAGVAVTIQFEALVQLVGGAGLDVQIVGNPFPGSGTESTFAQASRLLVERIC